MKNKELKDHVYGNVYQNSTDGYVLTPSALAFEMISTLPDSVFESDKNTFLDPICKSGTFLFEIVEKLYDKGHSIDNIQKRIYTIDSNFHSLNVAKSTIGKILNSYTKIKPNHNKYEWVERYYNQLIALVSNGKYTTFDDFLNIIMIDKNELYLMKLLEKNVSDFIEKYEKVSKLESKLFGEVFTPRLLISEMLDTLPPEVWKNKDLKWLDPAVGIGNFPAVILDRLMVGLEGVIPDEGERRKHILEEMLYMCDISTKNLFLLYMLFDKNNEFKLNVYRGSFLTEEFDKHMKEEWKLDGVDVVVGNPPYQLGKNSNFYVKFIDKFKRISNIDSKLLFITPNRFFQPSHKAHKAIEDCQLIKLFHNLGSYFPGVTTHIGAFLLSKNTPIDNNRNIECYFDSGSFKGGYNIDFNKPIPTDPRLSDPIYMNIITKITDYNKKINFDSIRGENNIFIKRQWKRWNSITEIGGDHVFNVVLDYSIDRDGKDGKWLKCDNIDSINWYLSKSKIIRFLTKSFASAMNVPPFIWTIIPDIDLYNFNNDLELYNLLNLTQDEISLIEKNLR